MTTTAKLNEYNHAEEPARRLLEQLGVDVLFPVRRWPMSAAMSVRYSSRAV